jgi:hypothetical protein
VLSLANSAPELAWKQRLSVWNTAQNQVDALMLWDDRWGQIPHQENQLGEVASWQLVAIFCQGHDHEFRRDLFE